MGKYPYPPIAGHLEEVVKRGTIRLGFPGKVEDFEEGRAFFMQVINVLRDHYQISLNTEILEFQIFDEMFSALESKRVDMIGPYLSLYGFVGSETASPRVSKYQPSCSHADGISPVAIHSSLSKKNKKTFSNVNLTNKKKKIFCLDISDINQLKSFATMKGNNYIVGILFNDSISFSLVKAIFPQAFIQSFPNIDSLILSLQNFEIDAAYNILSPRIFSLSPNISVILGANTDPSGFFFLYDSSSSCDCSTLNVALIVSLVVVFSVLLIVTSIGLIYWWKKKKNSYTLRENEIEFEEHGIEFLSDVSLENRLGGGNFGDVYQGTWKSTNVALKKLRDMDKKQEFFKEAVTLESLNFPKIVKYYGLWKDLENSIYICMEFIK